MSGREASLQTETEIHQVLDSLPAAAYTCDLDGLITYFNQRAVAVWGREPKINDPSDRFCGSFKLYGLDGNPILHSDCWMALALRESKEFNGHEIVIEKPDGARITAMAYANPLKDSEGQTTGAVNVLVDISDRKRTEEALQEADRCKDEFLATLAHELRNPLAPIRNSVQLLKMADGDVSTAPVLEIIERQVDQLVRLVDDLIDISRIAFNKIELRRERVELSSVIRSVVEAVRPAISAHNHRLVLSLPDEPLYLHADPARLSQMFTNLLTNAAKFTPDHGTIWFTASIEGEMVKCVVKDDGIGISPLMLEKVFETFTQIKGVIGSTEGGLGIGLSLVRRLARMHGGDIMAESLGSGQGSTFTLTLPRAGNVTVAAERKGQWAQAVGQGFCRILVVDDNEDAATTLGMMLEHMGHETLVAHDGHKALEQARAGLPDVVLLDIGLPGLNGYEVARALRQEHGEACPVLIALTGLGQDEDRRRSAEAGFNVHLVKPVGLATLKNLLAGIRIPHVRG